MNIPCICTMIEGARFGLWLIPRKALLIDSACKLCHGSGVDSRETKFNDGVFYDIRCADCANVVGLYCLLESKLNEGEVLENVQCLKCGSESLFMVLKV